MPAALPACRWIRQKASQSTVSSDNVMSLFFPPSVRSGVLRGLDLESNVRSDSFGLQVENSRSQDVLTVCARSRAALVDKVDYIGLAKLCTWCTRELNKMAMIDLRKGEPEDSSYKV